MPRRDRTGPFGIGSFTGRKLGNCNSVSRPKFLGYGYRMNKQYKNRYFHHFIWLILSAIIGIYYILKTGINNNKKGR